MPTFRRIRRSIAVVLLFVYLPACHHYVTPKGMTPEAYIAAEQPKRVRVTLENGTRLTILDPFTSHDSLLGYIPVRQSDSAVVSGPLWAASLESVRRLEVYKLNTGATVGLTGGVLLVVVAATGFLAILAIAASQGD
jgi:hypothetical protein